MHNKLLFKKIRILLYIALEIFLCIFKFTKLLKGSCYIYQNLHILCPTCGITRATIAILNFNFKLAIQYNAYFTLVLFPIFFILIVEDIYCFIRKKRSLVDVIFGD